MDYRTFLALPLADVFLEEITQCHQVFKNRVSGVKWVLPQQVHITLHFFGNTSEEQLTTIRAVVRPIAEKFMSLNIALKGVGAFPDERRPRVIWLGVDGDVSTLTQLQGEIENALGQNGFVLEDRKFKAHATMGRVKDPRNYSGKNLNSLCPLTTATRIINRLILYQSFLEPGGSRYEALETFPLSGLKTA